MSRFLYFAYGSNLLAARLIARCPSARPLGRAVAPGHGTAFDVAAADGSAKVGLRADPRGAARGRLWEIAEADRPGLARAEGTNYREVADFAVTTVEGSVRGVTTWLPIRSPEPGRPWHWYRALVLAGAEEAGLDAETFAAFAAAPFAVDPLPTRASFLAARTAIAEAGRLDLLDATAA